MSVVEEPEEGEGEVGGKPLYLRLDAGTRRYLDDLVNTRLYGSNPTAVVRQLVRQGIQDAIAKNHVKVRSRF